jgi:hypothetical protein
LSRRRCPGRRVRKTPSSNRSRSPRGSRWGVEVTFIRVKNAGHSFQADGIDPSLEEIRNIVIAFFDKKLKSER